MSDTAALSKVVFRSLGSILDRIFLDACVLSSVYLILSWYFWKSLLLLYVDKVNLSGGCKFVCIKLFIKPLLWNINVPFIPSRIDPSIFDLLHRLIWKICRPKFDSWHAQVTAPFLSKFNYQMQSLVLDKQIFISFSKIIVSCIRKWTVHSIDNFL